MARETITRYFCDFCGSQTNRGDLTEISGGIGRTRADGQYLSVVKVSHPGEGNPELCPNCYEKAIGALAPFVEYINTKGGRVTPETEEAAHE